MRIGFAAIYSWRPHVEHLYFLAKLAEKGGHNTYFLACDADLPNCYARESKDGQAWRECLQCRAGNIRSYTKKNVSALGAFDQAQLDEIGDLRHWAHSSASTLGRFESDADYSSNAFQSTVSRLEPAVRLSYVAARQWIQHNHLDAVCVFNGRMDVTRAIYEAARSEGIRVVSLERTWFGDGLQLYPNENCLGLGSVDSLMKTWRNRPLTRAQALRSASHVAGRFLRNNVKEWRAYNRNATAIGWPVENSKRRILLVPSSRNEVWGHPDWTSGWAEPTAAYDALMNHLCLGPRDVLLRCHPNWGEKIGKEGGQHSERYYTEWACRRNIAYIPSTDNASTLSLIEQCDAIVVANGSAALEAGMLGKQVIGIAPSIYQQAGLRESACNPTELASVELYTQMDPSKRASQTREVARKTLRFCYTMVYRIPQYAKFVKADATTRYRYDFTADPARFIQLLRTGRLEADDETFAGDTTEESEVLDMVASRRWKTIVEAVINEPERHVALKRRPLFRPIDLIGRWKPVGDR